MNEETSIWEIGYRAYEDVLRQGMTDGEFDRRISVFVREEDRREFIDGWCSSYTDAYTKRLNAALKAMPLQAALNAMGCISHVVRQFQSNG